MIFNLATSFPIGLDISDLSLKLFQLNKSREKISIQAINSIDLPKGLIEEGEIKDKEGVIKAIKELIEKPKFGKVTSSEVVACLPETKTFIKLIEIDKTPNDLHEVVKIELEKHIPLSIEEIYFDWQIINDLPNKLQILVGAAPKQIVDQYTDLIDAAGLSVNALEIESISIARSLLADELTVKTKPANNYMILDIGAMRSSIVFYSSGTILFSVSLPISGELMTDQLSKDLKIDPSEAEKAKIICGFDESRADGIVKKLLEKHVQELVARIKEVQKFYSYHYAKFGKMEKLLLCGGGANMQNLDIFLKDQLNLDVAKGNSFTNLQTVRENFSKILSETYSIRLGDKKKAALTINQNADITFSTAVGLALRDLFIDEV